MMKETLAFTAYLCAGVFIATAFELIYVLGRIATALEALAAK